MTLAVLFLATGATHAEERKARIEVTGLWCPSCSYIVGEALQKSESVAILNFQEHEDGRSGVYTITFDDAVTDLGEIAAQPAAYGYTAVLLDDGTNSGS
ncbi:hypothetical protein B0E33_30325 (plasmid) [Roseibium algicola]|uniref:HMA domain-containing protein n=2 Tax=Roseibium algicola TaxID=2857014 RepID=A0ABM6ICE2_9HYPH|nr:hypothetical protein B0E33_30325 [Roseibium aggregatum]